MAWFGVIPTKKSITGPNAESAKKEKEERALPGNFDPQFVSRRVQRLCFQHRAQLVNNRSRNAWLAHEALVL
ncbi:hypothetical protein SPI_05995 [Niveomyces insectorum RCEF 264]|uniref:Uncharacterized protein n=1 Tax=Niveomyces insectorum RCEF 264 TaxID=1081102 RepID=A0A167SP14_9HYPO|nr:hypothetical protein SPI_05995 [Niveomyces insectorum RCEF 264]